MKHLVKRIGGALLALVMVLALLPGTLQTALAETEGDYEYSVTDGQAEITNYIGIGGDVTIPDTLGGYPVTGVADLAFYWCESLLHITIPASLTTIGDGTFSYKILTSIDVAEENPAYASVDGVLFNKEKTELIQYPAGKVGPYTIPDGVISISDRAFYACNNLTGITIPSSVKSIGQRAFAWCTGLRTMQFIGNAPAIGANAFDVCDSITAYYPANDATWTEDVLQSYDAWWPTWVSYTDELDPAVWDYTYDITDGAARILRYTGVGGDVVIPATLGGYPVTGLAAGSFQGRTDLSGVTMPDSLTNIEYCAFQGCTGLTSVTIPAGVTYIGEWAFEKCTALTNIAAAAENTAYTSVDGVLFSKDKTELKAYPGGRTGAYVIPAGVTSIADTAFQSCAGLTGITIPSGVTSIGNQAFCECESLTDVTIPNSVTSIGSRAFLDCTGLTGVTIGDSMTSYIDYWFFEGCTALVRIDVAANNSAYASADGVLFNKDKTEILLYPAGKTGSYVIPDSVTSIGSLVFSDTALYNDASNWTDGVLYIGNCLIKAKSDAISGSYTVRAGTRLIADGAFTWCENLTSISIPNSVTSIGAGAFADCTSLASVTIPNSVKSLGSNAFAYCTNLASVTIPSSVKSIQWGVFEDCTSLTSVTIPDGVTSIGGYAFARCDNLTSISIPNSVTSVGGGTFKYTALYNDASNWTDGVLYIGNCLIEANSDAISGSYTIRAGTRLIADGAFEWCENLTSIAIPAGVKSIGSDAFYECTNLTSISIPSSVTSIGGSAFSYCENLANVTIPDSVTSIQSMAFRGCTSLTSATIPSSVTSIQYNTFEGCTSLENVTIPSSVTSIQYSAFVGCKSLTSVEIPNSVTSIEDYAFGGCAGLTSVTFAGHAPHMEKDAFRAVTATANYPSNDSTWTENVRQNYGGKLTWVAYEAAQQSIVYEVLEAQNTVWNAKEGGALVVRSSADFSKFVEVRLDGKVLDTKNYEVKEGSTVVTVKAEYLATLSGGEHTLEIVSTDGVATASFTVIPATNTAETPATVVSPKDGDTSLTALWLTLALISLAGAAVMMIADRKKRRA